MLEEDRALEPGRLRRSVAWADARKRGTGMWAFVANRVTGLGLVAYLYLHLAVLSLLAGGPDNWDPFIDLVRSPVFLALDVLLIAGWLIHALNGIRLILLTLGIGQRYQRAMFVGLMGVAGAALVVMALLVFGG